MSGPPKMRLPYAPAPLRLVESDSPAAVEGVAGNRAGEDAGVSRVFRGVAYTPQQRRQWLTSECSGEGWIGGSRLELHCGEVLPLDEGGDAYCWDSVPLAGAAIAENEFQLLASSVEGLAIEAGIDCALLSIIPRFAVSYKTPAYPAQLGEIRLVSSSRFVTDTEGRRHNLLDTEEAPGPVLYREGVDDCTVVRQCCDWQPRDTEQHYNFDYRISQPLRRDLLGVEVQSITVLEQYSSYFMQRPVAAVAGSVQWVPAYAPVSWGWSLRVEPEADDWVITRRKLIMPVVGHDGWQMPQWQGDSIQYQTNTK